MDGRRADNGGSRWDRELDLLVFGAGGGGLAAAVVGAHQGLEVLVCEKTSQVGGTTGTSGGAVWIGGTTQSRRTPTPDSVEAARTYLDGEVGNFGAAVPVRDRFFAIGARVLDWFEQNSEVRFKANSPYPDYHPERPGGAKGGRTLGPLPFDGAKLGADFALVRPPRREFMVLGGMMVGRDEIRHLIRPWRSFDSFRIATKIVLGYLRDRLSNPRGLRLLLGNALIGRLLYSYRQKNGQVVVDAKLVELLRDADGRVEGAVVDIAGRSERIRARSGVILACGGCAGSAKWRRELVPDFDVPHTLAFDGDTGDGLDAGIAAGGELDRNHSTPFWWMPASIMRWSDGDVTTYPHIRDRPKPGLIAVNKAGRRFVNEGNSYHDFVHAMFATSGPGSPAPAIPAFLICDRRFVHEYGLGVIHPVWQQLSYFIRQGYLHSAPTLAELAAKIGVDARGLEQSVAEHNRYAGTGVDEAFGKGSTALNRYNGDADNKPNPCLHPIAKAPFFALPVHPAPIGSSLGLRTNADAQVLDSSGAPIAGLYACGNDMSSIMGGFYPGPGITLGPALVFGWIAAMHAAGKDVVAAAVSARNGAGEGNAPASGPMDARVDASADVPIGPPANAPANAPVNAVNAVNAR